jgi:Mor family transcriptional regulator
VGELLRIANKELIQQLEFTGNDIEYLGAGLFINLQPHFPNLIDLNGKNYLSLIRKPSSSRQQMKKIIAQTHHMQREMMKTLKKEERTVKALRRAAEQECMRT